MTTILSVKKDKKAYILTIDNNGEMEKIRVSEDTIINFRILKKMEIDNKKYEDIIKFNNFAVNGMCKRNQNRGFEF